MTGQTIGTAVAKKDDENPSAIIATNRADLARVMPSHVRTDSWVRIAQGIVRRDKNLAHAARQSPGTLMVALMEAARLGLEPGTEQYYLTPRKNKGKPEVLGIPGYQGLIELMYRSGAVSSVVVETVRENDTFQWAPGRMERPEHEADWFAINGERGQLRGVYAYAIMSNGATSKVVVLNRNDIARARDSAQGADSEHSPWKNHEEAMWLKTAARRLAKWVPTSTEDRRIVQGVAERSDQPTEAPLDLTDEPDTDQPIEGELVDEEATQ
ncbi:recombination protein RecT [Actinopolyspora xinjiangensis]|uniref:Recombination protein RecT n=1 Tax=Actinopolyspora xinjiangensis TaxID=405564 RepID=A0A1H0U543_9ACTN|nr:recombinase RecT [Actinopolyspora xinjiangensis]SDP61279.1 recombination protein RecT [Actinopolyspora xinjiangensis]